MCAVGSARANEDDDSGDGAVAAPTAHRFNIGLSYNASIGSNPAEPDDPSPFVIFPVSPALYLGWRMDTDRYSYDLGIAGSGPEFWEGMHGFRHSGVPVILRTRLAIHIRGTDVWIGAELDGAFVIASGFWVGLRAGVSWRPLPWVELFLDPIGIRLSRGGKECALAGDSCHTYSQLGYWPAIGMSLSAPRGN